MRYSSRDEDMFPTITTANLMSNYFNTDKKEVKISSVGVNNAIIEIIFLAVMLDFKFSF